MKQKLIDIGLVVLGALATGTMVWLALPLGEQSYLAWVMLIPLLLATKEKGLMLGFLGGLGSIFWCAFLATAGFIYQHKHWEPAAAWTYTACGIFAASFSLFFGIYAEKKNHERPILWLAAMAIVLEAALLFQIPAHLALTQYRNWTMMLVASVGSIWLVSFLIWAFNIYLSKNLKKHGWIGLVVMVASFGITRFDPFAKEAIDGFSVGVAQITDAMDKEQVAAHKAASLQKPIFVVWPEFAGMMFVMGEDTGKLKQLSKETAPIITSFRDTYQPLPHNIASLFANGEESKRYEKRKLFGSESKMHTPGKTSVAVPIPGQSFTVGLDICFDSCFPMIIRETASQPNAAFVALPTIDPDSLHYFMAGMHAAYTPFRCAENGIAMARADGNFGSMIVNERGAIVKELKNEQTSAVAKVSGKRVWTLAGTKIGDWFLYLCLGIAFYPSVKWVVEKTKRKA
jgi:apolipoprotein N-acyltransferase